METPSTHPQKKLDTPLLQVINLSKSYSLAKNAWNKKSKIQAVDSIHFSLHKNNVLGIVGESGCGKSTLARCVLQLESLDTGDIIYNGHSLLMVPRSYRNRNIYKNNIYKNKIIKNHKHNFRKHIQMIFQDPYESLNPRHSIQTILTEPLRIHTHHTKSQRLQQAVQLLEQVGLNSQALTKYPHEFSGGQRQRICIARALILNPNILLCDEPVSALDVSVQAQILNLLMQVKNDFQLSYIFISHDLSSVRHLSDQVAVMYLGKFVETGPTERIFTNPLHPYTKMLLQAIPQLHTRLRPIEQIIQEIPTSLHRPTGCAFHPRCAHRTSLCTQQSPPPCIQSDSHQVQCWLYANTQNVSV